VSLDHTFLAIILYFLSTISFLGAQSHDSLPRKSSSHTNHLPQNLTTSSVMNGPPKVAVRTMAEWEEVEYLLVSWTQYPNTLREIVRYAREVCKVLIICGDSVSVKAFLVAGRVRTKGVSFIHAYPNSVWIRDYGPQSVYMNEVDSLALVDWIYNRARVRDDQLSEIIATHTSLKLFTTTQSPYELINIGGNFLTDGMGTAFSSQLVLRENKLEGLYSSSSKNEAEIDRIMQTYMGIERYLKMPMLPYDRIHHIDMHLKLLDEETLLIGQYPEGVADGPHIERNFQELLANEYSSFGSPYRVIRIPMPSHEGFYPDAKWVNYRTYTNAVLINRLVLVPQYECSEDSLALEVYRNALPGYKIIGVDVSQLIQSGGALHCVTQTIGVRDPLRIIHQPIRAFFPETSHAKISAMLAHVSGISQARVFYKTTENPVFSPADMQQVDPFKGIWEAYIPLPHSPDQLLYYIEATSYSGKIQRRPMSAPKGYWRVRVGGDVDRR